LFGIAMLLIAAAAGCGGSADPSPSPSAPASPAAAPTSSPSPVAPTGLLYSAKSATFSSIWATEHSCPVNVYIDFTDSGPQVRNPDTDGAGTTENGTAWPRLKWSPPCSGITQEITFDAAPVAKVSGAQTQSSCQASAEQSRRNGTGLRGYRLAALAVGDQFCEYYTPTGPAGQPLDRVILMRVASVSASNPIQVTWSVTAWALASTTATASASAGDSLYADQTFVMGDGKDCVPASVNLQGSSGPTVRYGSDQTSGDIVYFPACLGEAKIRFGNPAAPVSGDPGAQACEDAAAGSGQNSLDVNLTALHAGSVYCQFSSQLKTVMLVKVVSITKSPASITFSATGWQAPISK
jgi:hypothetical protein